MPNYISHPELLNLDFIKSVLEPETLFKLGPVEILNSVDSTNTYMLSKAKTGIPNASFCFAEDQIQGRGRLGRTWISQAHQHICFSLLWRFANSNVDSNLSLAVGVMVANALQKAGIVSGIQLKWPNDIYLMDRKVAGILIESNEINSVVIGVGINLTLPQAADHRWIGLNEIGSFSRNYLAGLLINELLMGLNQYEHQGLSAFLPRWQGLDYLSGKKMKVEIPGGCHHGVGKGINESGEMLLALSDGKEIKLRWGEATIFIDQ